MYSLGAITDIEKYQKEHLGFECSQYYELYSMYCNDMDILLKYFDNVLVESFRGK